MEKKIDFNTIYDRRESSSAKYDLLPLLFGTCDITPLWIADMDFKVPSCVMEGVKKRLEHPIFGYTLPSKNLFEATSSWFKRRHNLNLEYDKVVFSGGVISGFFSSLMALGEKGDGVIIPTPTYPPFFSITKSAGLEIKETKLLKEDGSYTFNFDEIENLAKTSKFFILCNPHNPTGRVWRENELKKLIAIALKNNLIILSDDIHCDFVFDGEYLPLSKIAPKDLSLITAYSGGKTFNIPGLNLAFLNFSSDTLKESVEGFLNATHINHINPITTAVYEEIYTRGDAWVDSMLVYLKDNRDLAFKILSKTKIIPSKPESTMLMWLDCSELKEPPQSFFKDKCKLALNDGVTFGGSYKNFVRLNFATQRSILQKALEIIKEN